MKRFTREQIEILKQTCLKGTRVCLEYMAGEEDMTCGLKGTVEFVDGIGQIHVKWDNGRTLAIVPEEDKYLVINTLKQTKRSNE